MRQNNLFWEKILRKEITQPWGSDRKNNYISFLPKYCTSKKNGRKNQSLQDSLAGRKTISEGSLVKPKTKSPPATWKEKAAALCRIAGLRRFWTSSGRGRRLNPLYCCSGWFFWSVDEAGGRGGGLAIDRSRACSCSGHGGLSLGKLGCWPGPGAGGRVNSLGLFFSCSFSASSHGWEDWSLSLSSSLSGLRAYLWSCSTFFLFLASMLLLHIAHLSASCRICFPDAVSSRLDSLTSHIF